MLLLFLLGFLTAVLGLSGDTPKDGIENESSASVYTGDLYVFTPGTERVLEFARLVSRPSCLSVPDALSLLARHLEKMYFFKQPDGEETHIRFVVKNFHFIGVPHRRYCIAVIDMKDEDEVARRHFFQGSFGGQTTFFMIAATFLQAQNDPPLLDGLILLYNGKLFPQMDHIDFSGIVTPKSVRRTVLKVIASSKLKSE